MATRNIRLGGAMSTLQVIKNLKDKRRVKNETKII